MLILDTGLSTITPVDAAIRASREPALIRHLRAFTGQRFEATVRELKQQPYGTHADGGGDLAFAGSGQGQNYSGRVGMKVRS